jgi:uncharacterized repeat protein (TIGR01451 family)
VADLQITKNDGITTYAAGTQITYTIIITNNGPDNISGAVLIDNIPAQVTTWDWACTTLTGGAANCTGVTNSAANFNDVVDLPNGASITYTVTANISTNAAGTLTNTAIINGPVGSTELTPGDNTATDSDTPASSEPDIGVPNGSSVTVAPGTGLTIVFNPAIIADGDAGIPDFVYYEILAAPTYVDVDWVRIEISSDGITWYQVFYWHNPSAPDTNTNMDLSLVGDICQVASVPTETDNCSVPIGRLYNSTGITVDIDGIVPLGSYSWMRISSPAGSANGANIDAIQPYYP